MLIDWFTVGAQALNFIVLVWLLKRFLYKPILNAVAAREQLIAAQLADASVKKAEAQKERDTFQHKNETFDQQRAALMNKATGEANAERQRLLDDARKAADALSAKRHSASQTEARSLNQAIRSWTQQEVFAITRKALTDLAGASLEDRMTEVFTQRLREMDSKTKIGFAEAFRTRSEPALVRTAFDLPADQRTTIQKTLQEAVSAKVEVRFETSAALISGIELSANGQKVCWSIAEYLGSLETGVANLLRQDDKPVAKVAPKRVVKASPRAKPKPATRAKRAKPEPKPR